MSRVVWHMGYTDTTDIAAKFIMTGNLPLGTTPDHRYELDNLNNTLPTSGA